ncbi:MAG: tetratricopeptide repeat protein [Ignavibacteriales bacterium]|nr:tetratricopeptide repeat protein [Ignavibacteriales bacterium]
MKNQVKLILLLIVLFISVSFAQDMDNQAALLYNEGNALLNSGDYTGAVNKYNDAIQIQNHYKILYQKGVSLKKLGKNEDAIGVFNSCIGLKSDFDLAYNGKGGAEFAVGKYMDAIQSFEKFKSLTNSQNNKNTADLYIALAYTQMAKNANADGKSDKAIEYLNSAVKHNKYDAAYLLMAEIYVNTGKYNDAITAADNALNNRKSNSKISKVAPYYYKGLAFKWLGNTQKAIENFELCKNDPTYGATAKYELDKLK